MTRLLYPVEEAQEQLGVGRTTVYALAKRGEIAAVKIGRRTLITAESLEAFVERLASVSGELDLQPRSEF